ncbi:hypothetical protein AB1Y20_004477 [Prymnesium parvum]|uniref:Calmodulin n=1 Tax=Prymnesium parvum TaxID=97485 RepID=A0AB34IWU5_PRYPA
MTTEWAMAADEQEPIGKPYYYVPGTDQVTYEPPLPPGWAVAVAYDGRNYYYNSVTGATSYERPNATAPTGVPLDPTAKFSIFDADGDGFLTIPELRRLVHSLRLDLGLRNRVQKMLHDHEVKNSFIDRAGITAMFKQLEADLAASTASSPYTKWKDGIGPSFGPGSLLSGPSPDGATRRHVESTTHISLPSGWHEAQDSTGRSYYYDSEGRATYETPLPEGWAAVLSGDGRKYYYCERTRETTYDRPRFPASRELPESTLEGSNLVSSSSRLAGGASPSNLFPESGFLDSVKWANAKRAGEYASRASLAIHAVVDHAMQELLHHEPDDIELFFATHFQKCLAARGPPRMSSIHTTHQFKNAG